MGTQRLTSYDIPAEIRDKINAMNEGEIWALQASVKPPSQCKPGDADLVTWWACDAALRGMPASTSQNSGVDISELADFDFDD